MKTKLAVLALSLAAALVSSAAPQLRMSTAAFGPFSIAQGSNGPTQSVTLYNIGDGTLSPKATSADAWLAPTVGASTMSCGLQPGPCFPVTIALQTSSLTSGSYTGFVTVSDPNAVDSPQTISVTVNIGGGVPSQFTFYTPPGGTATANYSASNGALSSSSTKSGGNWLSVTSNGLGSLSFTMPSFTVKANAGSLGVGDYSGSVVVANSSLASENKNVPVTLHVTTEPIAQAFIPTLTFEIPQGGPKQNIFTAYPYYILLTNAGQGTLTPSGATAATTSGGSWLTVAIDPASSSLFQVTADATGLSLGSYQGTITVASNAANSPTVIPVQLTVVAPGPPTTRYPVANGFTQSAADGIAQGDFIALFGSQFTNGDPIAAPSLPLGTDLGDGTKVLVNGTAVPIQFDSYGQINIQLPYNTPLGSNNTLQVVRNGTPGNTVSLTVAARAPAVLPWSGGPYVLAQTTAGGFEGYSSATPAHVGDVLSLYAVGLGPTTPAVAAGTAAPCPNSSVCSVVGPLAEVTPTPNICFGTPNAIGQTPICVKAQFAGLTPTVFSLYQLNFQVPDNAPKGSMVPIFVQMTDVNSNLLYIAIQ